jgi:hypothetical protein
LDCLKVYVSLVWLHLPTLGNNTTIQCLARAQAGNHNIGLPMEIQWSNQHKFRHKTLRQNTSISKKLATGMAIKYVRFWPHFIKVLESLFAFPAIIISCEAALKMERYNVYLQTFKVSSRCFCGISPWSTWDSYAKYSKLKFKAVVLH